MVKLLENSKEDYVSVASKTLTHFIINITKKEKIAIFLLFIDVCQQNRKNKHDTLDSYEQPTLPLL